MSASLDWSHEKASWPHAEASEFRTVGARRWHVQRMGRGPVALLVHGTGASTHSFRTLAPRLAQRYTVVMPDLPGHGFTERRRHEGLSLPNMARAVAELADALALEPTLVVGHSAGAAILLRCCLDGTLAPEAAVAINGALLPFRGAAGFLFPPLAKLLFLNPLVPRVFARSARDRERVVRLIRGTGSVLDDSGIDLYARLFASPRHVAATLGMMANWNLHRLTADLSTLTLPLLLVVGEDDEAVDPADAERVRRRLPAARIARLPGLGHLAHEEDADAVAEAVLDFASGAGG
ncbi:alpha/beta fold hydrolase BchO [Halomonas denitrificans]|nr:alpha/beta fold hydrolase [Halomonas denitrificans]